MVVVVDASVAVAWALNDENSDYLDRVEAIVLQFGASVPQLWALEVANALLVAERRKRITSQMAEEALVDLYNLGLHVDAETFSRVPTDTVSLARRFNLSVYDAAYLELALRKGASLASQDKLWVAAAASAGVPLIP